MIDATRLSGVALASAIRRGEITAREAVEAHIARLGARPWLNAVVADRFAGARVEAKAADERIAAATDVEELPPFLGVPCTIKESIAVAGMPNSAGDVRRADVRPTVSAPAADRLLATGAILLGVTNTPELSLHWETANRLYGRTSNAYDRRRTAGGSSGGEGAAIGAGGSVFGLGSDIGGSIRIPAALNGVFGHMPTRGLVPRTGHHLTPDGPAAVMMRIGPLARSAADLMPLLRALAGPHPSDPLARQVHLGDPADVDLTELPVLVATGTTYLPARRQQRNARESVATALASAGAQADAVPLPALRSATTAYLVALNEGFGTLLADLLAEVPGTPRGAWHALRTGRHTLPVVLALVQERLHGLRPRGQVARILAAGQELARALEEQVGDGVLVLPSFPRLAPRHGATLAQPWLIGGLATLNLTDLPVTQVPIGLGRGGLPFGAQVMAGRDRDHVAIRVAQELERVFGGWTPPSP